MSSEKQIQFLSISPDDLADLISKKVENTFQNKFREIRETQEKKEFLTREETRVLLGVTYPTLWRYVRDGKLTQYNFEGKTFFKLSDIEQGFIKNG